MKIFTKIVCILTLSIPLVVFADQGMWLENKVDSPGPIYLTTKIDIIAKKGELFISDAEIPKYAYQCSNNSCEIKIHCIADGVQLDNEIIFWYTPGLGITKVIGSCVDYKSTFLPQWDHQPFGKISVFSYTPKR